MLNELVIATNETLKMTFIPLILSYLVSIPLAVISVETKAHGLFPNSIINKILQVIIGIGRAIPFVILMVVLLPFTRWLIGTGVGTEAVIVPLTICAIPFVTRIVETSLNKIDELTVEAAEMDGASKIVIIAKIKLLAIIPDLIEGVGITAIAIIGYTTMAGTVGGGGLGNYAIVYGFQRYQWLNVLYATLIIVAMVLVIQTTCNVVGKITRKEIYG